MLSDEYLKVVIAMADRQRQIVDADRIRSLATGSATPGRFRRWLANRRHVEPVVARGRPQPARTAIDPSV